MSLPRGYEPRLHADVQLLCAPNREPDAAASDERGRLGELRKPEQLAVEGPRLHLAIRRRGEQNVVETNGHGPGATAPSTITQPHARRAAASRTPQRALRAASRPRARGARAARAPRRARSCGA